MVFTVFNRYVDGLGVLKPKPVIIKQQMAAVEQYERTKKSPEGLNRIVSLTLVDWNGGV